MNNETQPPSNAVELQASDAMLDFALEMYAAVKGAQPVAAKRLGITQQAVSSAMRQADGYAGGKRKTMSAGALQIRGELKKVLAERMASKR